MKRATWHSAPVQSTSVPRFAVNKEDCNLYGPVLKYYLVSCDTESDDIAKTCYEQVPVQFEKSSEQQQGPQSGKTRYCHALENLQFQSKGVRQYTEISAQVQ